MFRLETGQPAFEIRAAGQMLGQLAESDRLAVGPGSCPGPAQGLRMRAPAGLLSHGFAQAADIRALRTAHTDNRLYVFEQRDMLQNSLIDTNRAGFAGDLLSLAGIAVKRPAIDLDRRIERRHLAFDLCQIGHGLSHRGKVVR